MAYKKYKVSYKYNLEVYWSLLKKYKGLAIFLLFIVLVMESITLVDKFLFKSIIDNGTEYLSGKLELQSYVYILLIILGIFVSKMIINTIGKWLYIHFINIIESKLIIDLKQKFFNHLIYLSYNFHTTHKTGSLISRLSRGSGAIERMTDFLIFNAAPFLFQIMVASASLIYFDWATSIVVLVTVIIFVTYGLLVQNIQGKANMKLNQREDIEKANISDIFTNIESIKYFGKEASIKKKFEKLSDETRKALLKHWNYYRWLDAGQSMIIALGALVLVYVSVLRLLDHKLTIGTLVFIYSVYGGLSGYLFGFVGGIRGFYRSIADFDPLFKYGLIENEIKDKPDAKYLEIKEGMIEFKNVSFKYNKRKIFNNFNLRINPGEKVAIVGHSGSGKTTLIRLLYRLYDVESGSISIDGINLKDFKQESLRSELSIVPQECVLFDDTIYNNVLFSNPKASRSQVFEAMRFAQLDNIIKLFPKKENTVVGERGVKLSGGEKQRVSISRAVLANKKIIILDEATSSLDSQTEYDIKQDLEKLLQNRTSIIIAHRLSTIMKSDRIVVLDKGKIVQIGSHNELINQEGIYKKLWTLQKGGYIN
jgi:ABC-type multidrug transport system fused ATPase/permease subunit